MVTCAGWGRCALVAALVGCGGHEDIISGGRDGGTVGRADASTVDAHQADVRVFSDAAVNPLGPANVSVTVPAPGSVMIGGRQTVSCHAEPNGTTLSPVTTVSLAVVDGASHAVTANGVSTSSSDWMATLVLDPLANGTVNVTCTATAADGKISLANSIVSLDLGPRVQFAQPVAGAAVHGNINVDFFATPLPIASPDPGSAVASVTATLAGKTLTLANPSAGHYTASVRADDTNLFDQPLDGAQTLQVTAVDSRGAVRRVAVQFVVDNTPPTISITSPLPSDLVGGVVTVNAKVTDADGIDVNTVVAVIGNGPDALASFPLATTDGQSFIGRYDTKELRAIVEATYGTNFQLVLPTLSVRARDLPGNEGSFGEQVYMDYMPPIASLNPPPLREARFEIPTQQIACSNEFNPLGLDSTIDLQSVAQLSELRARVEDRGNSGTTTSSVVLRLAGVDPAGVQLFILDNTNPAVGVGDALLVDTDGDGICDDINPMLRPTTLPMMATDALALNLVAVSPAGASFFGVDTYAGYAGCHAPSTPDADPPRAMCPLSSGLQRAIATPLDHAPEIYAIPQVDNLSCLGPPFDSVANNIRDGWACVAVRAVDKLGNVGISPPLRVCFDHDGNGAEGCPPLPTYSDGIPDVPGGTRTVILGTPGAVDCTGRYYRATATTPESTDPTMPCTPPPNFPLHQILRIDL